MGLPKAIKAHREGDLVLAETHYKRAIEQNVDSPIIYQNYGALLREAYRLKESRQIYELGIKLYPTNDAIQTNLANLLRNTAPTLSIYYNLKSFYQRISHGQITKSALENIINVLAILRELGLTNWSLSIVERVLTISPRDPAGLTNLLLLANSNSNNFISDSNSVLMHNAIEESLETLPILQRLEVFFALANNSISQLDPKTANKYYNRALFCAEQTNHDQVGENDLQKIKHQLILNSWNMSCNLLKLSDFEQGWKLFEHGLATPAKGKQRWQRALVKPFSSDELPLWRGESLLNKKLLLLDEQAIGDVMMFLSLLKSLCDEAFEIGLFLSDRLLPIYNRSFNQYINSGKVRLFSHEDFTQGRLVSTDFDFQSPLGSICQYRFCDIHSYAPFVPVLKSRLEFSQELREKYLLGSSSDTKLVGISWRGGGRSDRIKQKSIDENLFADLLVDLPGIRFISLQYGPCKKTIESWNKSRNFNVIYDDNINPLKNMESWLDQVSACDAVLSVANTTIHGSGGLNIPTMCLLSRFADWRWLDDSSVNRSYWYPSVGIAREHKTFGWDQAFTKTRQWLETGCLMPSGSFGPTAKDV